MDPLTKQTIILDVDKNTSEFSVEFIGCKVVDAYSFLKQLVMMMEDGEIFEQNGISLVTDSGEPADRDEIRRIIAAAKESLESR